MGCGFAHSLGGGQVDLDLRWLGRLASHRAHLHHLVFILDAAFGAACDRNVDESGVRDPESCDCECVSGARRRVEE